MIFKRPVSSPAGWARCRNISQWSASDGPVRLSRMFQFVLVEIGGRVTLYPVDLVEHIILA